VTLSIGSNLAGRTGEWSLTFPTGKIKVFEADGSGYRELASGEQPVGITVPFSKTLFVEGIGDSGGINDISLTSTFTPSSGAAVSDTIRLTVVGIDLGIDSDNDENITGVDNVIEDVADKPGKLLQINDDDTDGDGVADFADFDGIANEQFAPMTLKLPASIINVHVAKVRLSYDDSPPPGVTGTGITANPYNAAPGTLRVWMKSGSSTRREQSVANGGDWWEDGGVYVLHNAHPTLYVEAVRGSAALAADRIKVEVDPTGTGHWVAADSLRVTAFDLDFTKTYSDQVAGSTNNYLPGGSGGNANYILMGTRADDRAYARAQLDFSGPAEALSNFIFALVPRDLADWTYAPSFDIAGDLLHVSNVVDGAGAEPMKVVYGLDKNRDGNLSKDEVWAWSPHLLRVVNQLSYNTALENLSGISFAGSLPTPYSSNWLYAFANHLGLLGAVNSFDTLTLNSPGDTLDHHVGAGEPSEVWSVRKAVFHWTSASTTLPYDVASSQAMAVLIANLLDQHKQEVWDAFTTPGDQDSYGPWPLEESSINFAGLTDLHFALGKAVLRDVEISFTVGLLGPPHSAYDRWVGVTSMVVSGTVTDLQDFNYDGDEFFAQQAAIVQAGYPSLGSGGHILKLEVNMNNSIPFGYSFGDKQFPYS
jgi:hypothetical protein